MRHPLYRFFATVDSIAPTILRLLLAGIFCVHAGQKTLGWLGGTGWAGTLAQWTSPQGLNLTYPLAMLGMIMEAAGVAGMLLGFLTRFVALVLACTMATAVATVPWQRGFLAPKGFEYPLSLGAVALALLCCGGGRFSVDRLITRHLLPPNTGTLGGYRTM